MCKMALTAIYRSIQHFRISQFSKLYRSFLTETNFKNGQSFIFSNMAHNKYLCTKSQPKVPDKQTKPNAPEQQKKRKPLTSPQITLISPEGDIVSTTLEDAEKIGNRRNLKLVKIVDFDTKSQKPLYKLMTSQEYFEEEAIIKERKKKEKGSTKEEKFYNILSKISEHDLDIKIAQMMKLLKKKHDIRINVSVDGNPSKTEEIVKTICEELKDVSVQKNFVKKKNLVKLHLSPKEEKENIEDISKDINIKKTLESEKMENETNMRD